MGRVLRSYALEASQGLCGSDTCMPILDHKIIENTLRSDPSCLVLSCLVSLECTLKGGFSGACRSRPTLYRARASHPHGQGAQVLCT